MSKLSYSNFSILYTKDIQVVFLIIAIFSVVAFSLSIQAIAGDKKPLPPPHQTVPSEPTLSTTNFAKLDVSRDGKLSREEAANDEVLSSGFDIVDTDVNGFIDSNEYSVYVLTTSPN
jgi:hypothetical protein